MHIETITFDRVFDAVGASGDFSFESGGRRVFAVALGPGVIPPAGSTFAIAFGTPGDWSTVLAWRDLGTHTVGFRQVQWDLFWFDPETIIVLALLLALACLMLLGPLASGALVALLLALAYGRIRTLRRRKEHVRAHLLRERAPVPARAAPV